MRNKIMGNNSGFCPGPGGEYFRKNKSLQKTIYSILMGDMFPSNAEAELSMSVRRRCANIFAPFDIDAEGGVDIDEALIRLKSIASSHAMRVIKTWLNGWATSPECTKILSSIVC